jgi:chromosome segregation ATPase
VKYINLEDQMKNNQNQWTEQSKVLMKYQMKTSGRVDALGEDLRSVREHEKHLDSEISDLETKINNVEVKLPMDLKTKLSDMENQIGSLAGSYQSLTQQHARLDAKPSHIEMNLPSDLKTKLSDIENQIGSLTGSYQSLTQQLARLDAKPSHIEMKLPSDLKTKLSDIENQIGSLMASFQSLPQRVTGFNSDLAVKFKLFNEELADLGTKCQNVEEVTHKRFDSLTAESHRLETTYSRELDSFRTKHEELENFTGSISQQLQQVRSDVLALQKTPAQVSKFSGDLRLSRKDSQRSREKVSKSTPPPPNGQAFKSSNSFYRCVPGSKPLTEGIIARLMSLCGGNVYDCQWVDIFSDSGCTSDSLRKLVDLPTNTYFESADLQSNPSDMISPIIDRFP